MYLPRDMDTSENFRSNAAESPILRKWLLRALIVSLLLHLALFVVFKTTRLERFAEEAPDRLVPRVFNAARVEIDPKLLEQDPAEAAKPAGKKDIQQPTIDLPAETPSTDQVPKEIRAVPNAQDLATPLTAETQRPEPVSLATIQRLRDHAAKVAEDNAAFADLLKDPSDLSSTALTELSNAAAKSAGPTTGNIGSGPGGYSDIEDLLARTGPLGDGTKPLYMPAAPLFTYDSAELQAGGISALARLGLLIKKHPEASYVIEGYSDSIGSAEYNLELSRRRADSVRTWLVERMGVNPAQVETKGLGSTKFIVPANGDIDAEAPNRRVEIVIRTPDTP